MTTLSPQLLLELAQLEAKYPERFKAALSGTVGRFADNLIDLFHDDMGTPKTGHWSLSGYETVVQYYHMRRNELDRESN